jgi:hypothetical protein
MGIIFRIPYRQVTESTGDSVGGSIPPLATIHRSRDVSPRTAVSRKHYKCKAGWIIDRRRRHEDLPPQPTPREFVNGETLMYAGKQYRLKLVPCEQGEQERVRLVGATICERGSASSWFADQMVPRTRSRAPGHARSHLG